MSKFAPPARLLQKPNTAAAAAAGRRAQRRRCHWAVPVLGRGLPPCQCGVNTDFLQTARFDDSHPRGPRGGYSSSAVWGRRAAVDRDRGGGAVSVPSHCRVKSALDQPTSILRGSRHWDRDWVPPVWFWFPWPRLAPAVAPAMAPAVAMTLLGAPRGREDDASREGGGGGCGTHNHAPR